MSHKEVDGFHKRMVRLRHLCLAQHASGMMFGVLSFLSQTLLSMSFRVKVIHQDLCPTLQQTLEFEHAILGRRLC